jgi:hypothetical protein
MKTRLPLIAAAMLLLSCSTVTNLISPPTPTPTPTPTATVTPTETPTPTPMPTIVGIWAVSVDWEGDGDFIELTWEFQADHDIRFIPNTYDNTGTWSLDGYDVTLRMKSSNGFGAKYTGTLDSAQERIEGTMTNDDGNRGDWRAERSE